MENVIRFYDLEVWQSVMMIGILLGSLIAAQILKSRGPLKKSLIPNSVIGGVIVLVISMICRATTGDYLFDIGLLSNNGIGTTVLEVITYHSLAIGFIAMTLRNDGKNKDKKRTGEIINSGITTISGYLIQAVLGIIVTIVAAVGATNIVPGSGILLCFGFGQGTGQAMTQGANFDLAAQTGEKYLNMGLSLAAFGFLIASLGGVIVLNTLRRKNKLAVEKDMSVAKEKLEEQILIQEEVYENESIDKLSIQIALIFISYVLAFGIMVLLGKVAGNMIGTVYGFNFLFGVLAAVIVKKVISLLTRKGIITKKYTNEYLLNRIGGFAFDLMIVSGICAIQIHLLYDLLLIIIILVALGTVGTFLYVRYVSNKYFPSYANEQFLVFFGMLTGTASTGMILLREVDPLFDTPAADNVVYQNFVAILLALPLLILASSLYGSYEAVMSINKALVILVAAIVYFVVLNGYMYISGRRKKD